jgi:isocitrate/isopropylmalate dehydrogenase
MFDQQVEVIPCKTVPNVPTRHGALDVVIIRENMAGEDSGLERSLMVFFNH